ncbi:glycosyltransferase family 2 protein [Aquimarina sp. ERC-38]|nr:glycosyltransferase family 2 protein [Aquimarina sp. ERC-38]UZO82641.1 glycosyltransferase family 2 protein [Aquimarina sp. ERC-38]
MKNKIVVIIPAYNEEASIGLVLKEIPEIVSEVIVVDNGSTDQTTAVSKKNGAVTLYQPLRGYGNACLKGLEYVNHQKIKPDIIVFIDGDYSDYPSDIEKVIQPILDNDTDLVIGARRKELREAGSMTFPQIFGNWLATALMKLFFNSRFTDLGPLRAIKYDKLMALEMQDPTYGWTVEMQLKALKKKYKYAEIPVRYKKRIGVSKVSGTIKGAILAGVKILSWIFKYSFK